MGYQARRRAQDCPWDTDELHLAPWEDGRYAGELRPSLTPLFTRQGPPKLTR